MHKLWCTCAVWQTLMWEWRAFTPSSIEKIQRRATKYILNDSSSDYKSRLLSLNMLPLMYWLDLKDLVFLVKCLKDPHNTMNIYRYINFVSTNKTRASTTNKLQHKFARLSIGSSILGRHNFEHFDWVRALSIM